MKNSLLRRFFWCLTLLACCAAGNDGGNVMSSIYNGTANNVNYPAKLNILGSTLANPSVVTTTTPHGLITGDYVHIQNSAGNFAINGLWPVTVPFGSTTTFSVPVSAATAGTANTGTVQPITFGTSYTIPSDGDAEAAASVNTALQTLGDRTAALLYGTSMYKLAILAPNVKAVDPLTGGTWASVTTSSTAWQVIPATGTSTPVVTLPYKVDGILPGDLIDVEFQSSYTYAENATTTTNISGPIVPIAGYLSSESVFALGTQPFTLEKYVVGTDAVPLDLPNLPQGSTLNSVSVYFSVTNGHIGGLPAVYPSLAIYRVPLSRTYATVTKSALSTTAQQFFPGDALYASGDQLVMTYTCNQNNVIDKTQYVYYVSLVDESGTNAEAGNIYLGIQANVSTVAETTDAAVEFSLGYSIVDYPISPTMAKIPGSGVMMPASATSGTVKIHATYQVPFTPSYDTQEKGSLYIQPAVTCSDGVSCTVALLGNVVLNVSVLRSTGILGD